MLEHQPAVNEALTTEEEFGFAEGSLGHLEDEALPEAFFNAALWEQLSPDGLAKPAFATQPALQL